MLTIRRTVDEGVMMCADFAAPSRMPPTGDAAAGDHTKRVVSDVRSVDVRHDQEVCVGWQTRILKLFAQRLGQRDVGTHFAIDGEIGRPRLYQLERIAHLLRGGRIGGPEVRVRDERDARFQPKALDLLGREQRHVRDLLCGRVDVDGRVAHEKLPVGQDQHLHRRKGFDALALAR
jgi:hypothetical protein